MWMKWSSSRLQAGFVAAVWIRTRCPNASSRYHSFFSPLPLISMTLRWRPCWLSARSWLCLENDIITVVKYNCFSNSPTCIKSHVMHAPVLYHTWVRRTESLTLGAEEAHGSIDCLDNPNPPIAFMWASLFPNPFRALPRPHVLHWPDRRSVRMRKISTMNEVAGALGTNVIYVLNHSPLIFSGKICREKRAHLAVIHLSDCSPILRSWQRRLNPFRQY